MITHKHVTLVRLLRLTDLGGDDLLGFTGYVNALIWLKVKKEKTTNSLQLKQKHAEEPMHRFTKTKCQSLSLYMGRYSQTAPIYISESVSMLSVFF